MLSNQKSNLLLVCERLLKEKERKKEKFIRLQIPHPLKSLFSASRFLETLFIKRYTVSKIFYFSIFLVSLWNFKPAVHSNLWKLAFYRKYFKRKKRNFKFEINERSRHFQFSGNVQIWKSEVETWKLSNSRPRSRSDRFGRLFAAFWGSRVGLEDDQTRCKSLRGGRGNGQKSRKLNSC